MKTTRRNFVVEFKSGRRRSTIQPDSIWGNTDLKAMVRRVEDEAPHLFEPKVGEENLAQNDEVPLAAASELPPKDITETCKTIPYVDVLAETTISTSWQNQKESINPVSRTKKHRTRTHSSQAKMGVSGARPQIHSVAMKSNVIEQAADFKLVLPVDELIALEAENRALKALLAKQLLEENQRLGKLLQRFAIT